MGMHHSDFSIIEITRIKSYSTKGNTQKMYERHNFLRVCSFCIDCAELQQKISPDLLNDAFALVLHRRTAVTIDVLMM